MMRRYPAGRFLLLKLASLRGAGFQFIHFFVGNYVGKSLIRVVGLQLRTEIETHPTKPLDI